MKINGSYTFGAPQDILWPMLLDPATLTSVMPGCEKLEQVGENEYNGVLKIRVGPVQGAFDGHVLLTDIQAPDGYNVTLDGQGAPGFVKGNGFIRLEADNGSTILHYEGDARVGGRLASVGQRLLDSSAKAIIRQSLEGIEARLQRQLQPEEAAAENGDLPAAAAPSQTEFALGVARHMVADLLADEDQEDLMRKVILAGGLLLALLVLLEWFSGRVAAKTARRLRR